MATNKDSTKKMLTQLQTMSRYKRNCKTKSRINLEISEDLKLDIVILLYYFNIKNGFGVQF